jgi:hypothetical protein
VLTGRGGARVCQRPRAGDRHLSVRAPDVRDDGLWETAGLADDDPEVIRDFGSLWRAADKIVFSKTLMSVTTARTRTERDFDPGSIRRLKQSGDADLSVGGAELAGQALAAGLVDEIQLFLVPVIVGGGKRALPADVQARLRLIGTRGFASGVVYAHHAVDD